jgi:RNA polymerase sigma-70 factor (ECF subfamily)
MDESALIRAAQRGDDEAFEQLVRSYDQPVLRLAVNLLRSQEDARDVYQEAFLRVYRNLHAFRFDCSFHTWLYRIVSNLCLDQIRKRKVRKEEQSAVATRDGQVDRFQFLPEERASVDPQRQYFSSQLSSRIHDVLASLTPRERMVFECGFAPLATPWALPKKRRRTACFELRKKCGLRSEILCDVQRSPGKSFILPLR